MTWRPMSSRIVRRPNRRRSTVLRCRLKAGEGAMPNLVVPGQIAALSLYRDLHQFYAAKDELFPDRTSGLIFFENMMGIFFSGMDLTKEVLAETLPDIRVVVAEQRYDEKTGTPAMKLPGFAVVVQLRDPAKFELVMKEAWQKAIGLVNFTRGQKAQPGLDHRQRNAQRHHLHHVVLLGGQRREQGRRRYSLQFPARLGDCRRSIDHELQRRAGARFD